MAESGCDFSALLASPWIAVFVTACVAHEERGTPGWTGLRAGNATRRNAFAVWHNNTVALQSHARDHGTGMVVVPPPPRHWINTQDSLTTVQNRADTKHDSDLAIGAPYWPTQDVFSRWFVCDATNGTIAYTAASASGGASPAGRTSITRDDPPVMWKGMTSSASGAWEPRLRTIS